MEEKCSTYPLAANHLSFLINISILAEEQETYGFMYDDCFVLLGHYTITCPGSASAQAYLETVRAESHLILKEVSSYEAPPSHRSLISLSQSDVRVPVAPLCSNPSAHAALSLAGYEGGDCAAGLPTFLVV